jgi:flagellar hook-length control protein FliK
LASQGTEPQKAQAIETGAQMANDVAPGAAAERETPLHAEPTHRHPTRPAAVAAAAGRKPMKQTTGEPAAANAPTRPSSWAAGRAESPAARATGQSLQTRAEQIELPESPGRPASAAPTETEHGPVSRTEWQEGSPHRPFPARLLTGGAEPARGQPLSLNAQQHVQLVRRVAGALHAAPQQGGTLRLRLRPPELGSLRLEVTVEQGSLSARIEAETQMARNVLLDALPQLRDRLAEHGVRVEQFQIDVGRDDTGPEPRQSDHGRSGHRQPQSDRQRPDTRAGRESWSPEGPAATEAVVTLRELNVVI